MKRIAFFSIALFLISTRLLAYSETMANTVKGDYSGRADSLEYVLIEQFMNKTKGTFYSTPKDVENSSGNIYWQQAHAMDVLVYAYERHEQDSTFNLATRYKSYMRNWYTNKANNYSSGSTGFENPYTDDMCWICLTLMHMTEATGTRSYANTAKRVFDNTIMTRAVEDETGLWLPWNTDKGSTANACTVSPACLLATRLYDYFGTEKYLTYAEKFYNYMENNIVKSDGRVEEPPLTYTQGTFAEACRKLYHITGKNEYKNKAQTYIKYAFTSGRCTNGKNILRDEGSSMDQSIFKAVLIPYAVNYVLDEDMSLSTRRELSNYIQKNANTLWDVLDKESYPAMFCPYNWTKAYDSSKTASMGAMVSGASLMENCARMCKKLLEKDDETGIGNVSINEEENISGIYTLEGRLVCTPWQNPNNLPPGMYIINKKKVVIN